jgi:hypothetical protein
MGPVQCSSYEGDLRRSKELIWTAALPSLSRIVELCSVRRVNKYVGHSPVHEGLEGCGLDFMSFDAGRRSCHSGDVEKTWGVRMITCTAGHGKCTPVGSVQAAVH